MQDDLIKLSAFPNHILVFVVATYGDGGPPNNAARFSEWLKSTSASFKKINYAVFGLGDSGYNAFNGFGKMVDARLSSLGGYRIHRLGLGDASGDTEDDFEEWKDSLVDKVLTKFRTSFSDRHNSSARQSASPYELTYLSKAKKEEVFKGEPTFESSYSTQLPPFTAENPFLAKIVACEELYQEKSGRSCLKITLDISGSRLFWQVGYHLGVYVQNHFDDVNKLVKILRLRFSSTSTSIDRPPDDCSNSSPIMPQTTRRRSC